MAPYQAEMEDETTESAEQADRQQKEPSASEGDVKRYWSEIDRYEKKTKDWYERADKIVARYLDDDHGTYGERRFALLYANVETLKPSTYAKLPVALCERRFRDKDPAGRVGAEIMERCTNSTLDIGGVDEIFRTVRDDRLLVGRGQAWVRYEADIEQVESEQIDFKTRKPTTVTHDKLVAERLLVDYVYWRHFGHNLARTWSNVWLVWRICYYPKYEAIEKFGRKVADSLTYDAKPKGEDSEDVEANCCELYECWDSRKRLMSILVKGESKPVKSGPPPINFNRFFPCPEPCYATKASRSLIPTPDYEYYRDQAKDIDDLTAKISNLMDWLRVKAFIPRGPSDGGADAIESAVKDTGNDDIFIHVGSWAEWVEKGGAKALIDWLPIESIVKALQQAIVARNQLIQDVYQITGISDILRGQTDPDETFGAQNIKQNTGSRRTRNAKDEVARFCEDICKLMAEAIAENFQPDTLAQMSGFAYMPGRQMAPPPRSAPRLEQGAPLPQAPAGLVPPVPAGVPMPGIEAMGANGGPPLAPPMAPPQDPMSFGDEVVQLLRDDRMRTFRIKVETDSTTQPDDDVEKQRRLEFLNTVAAYLEKSVQALMLTPELAPAVKEILMFAARGFRAGRNMESVLEESIDTIAKRAQQPKEDKIDAVNKAKLEQGAAEHQQKMAQGDAQFKQTIAQNDQQHAQKMQQSDKQFAQTMAFEREKGAKEIEVDNNRHALELAAKSRDHETKRHDELSAQETERNAQVEDREAAHKVLKDAIGQTAEMQRSDESTEQTRKALEGISGGLEGLAKTVAAIMDEMGQPLKVIRDAKTNKIIGGQRGSRKVMIAH